MCITIVVYGIADLRILFLYRCIVYNKFLRANKSILILILIIYTITHLHFAIEPPHKDIRAVIKIINAVHTHLHTRLIFNVRLDYTYQMKLPQLIPMLGLENYAAGFTLYLRQIVLNCIP